VSELPTSSVVSEEISLTLLLVRAANVIPIYEKMILRNIEYNQFTARITLNILPWLNLRTRYHIVILVEALGELGLCLRRIPATALL
jgi:hypothetical protein